MIEAFLRNGATAGVQQVAIATLTRLDTLLQYATAAGLPDVAAWAAIAAADLARRAGLPQAEQLLAAARRQIAAQGDDGRMALTYLAEGDWYATPGSSPEALGWNLAPQQHPSPLPPADLRRAADFYGQAERLLTDTDIPRLRAAIALRQALLARAAGDQTSRRGHLQEAMADFRIAGDSASYHLAAIHELVTDIDEGVLGRHALDLGGGWHRPTQGPVADALAWAETMGSRSWCVGLGRLLERCGDQWSAQRSAVRSRIAYLAALQLISMDPDVPSQTLLTAVADADSRNNLATNALLRLERTFGPLFANASAAHQYAFEQKLEASFVLVSALRGQSRGPAAVLAADRMALLARQLANAADQLRASLPPAERPVPATMNQLQTVLQAMQGDGSLKAQSKRAEVGSTLMKHMQLNMVQRNIDMADVLGWLTRAEADQRAGRLAEADRWFAHAIDAAGMLTADAHLLPLALLSAHRFDEARAALLVRKRQIPDEYQLPMWLRVKDYDNALETLKRMEAAGFVPQDWRDLQSVAELHLARGNLTEAQRIIRKAIAAFEDSARLLLRDPERLDACDQPDVAALYGILAMTYLPSQGRPTAASTEASFEAAELARSLTTDSGLGKADPGSQQAWQHAAAAYAAAANRLLADLPSATAEEQTAGFAALDTLDDALAAAEHTVDTQDPGILLRRTGRPPQPTSAQLRQHMPEGTLLLEYLVVGDDLLAWAMTQDTIRPERQSVRLRDLAQLVRAFHTACADGHAPATKLASLLLEPFTDLLRTFSRVVVVPFGPLSLVPFHVLPLDGAPLALSHVVSYAQRAASLSEHDQDDRPFSPTHPLVVADPAFDTAAYLNLKRLPGSQVEATAVAGALRMPADSVLVGPAATETAVGGRLDECDLLHVASHGHLDELSPFASSLVLAERDELTVADITGRRFGTDLAVLTGCDTGRGNATMGGDLIGLTRSLLRSGVRRTVVSLWPVDDWVAPIVMARFYAGLADHLEPAYALAQTQREIRGMSAEQLRTAYTRMGGDPDANANRRRGIDLDPDLRDEEEIPEPMGGDAERYWAPFIIVE
ncbi:CHAT domain-containing protein [Streptomyces sp. NBC_00133]|uniref:CHAT domain-containing protein n=1 Tax=Streptomyces sp. NBC_00133 TaxID=2903624 RepID=UPI003246992A